MSLSLTAHQSMEKLIWHQQVQTELQQPFYNYNNIIIIKMMIMKLLKNEEENLTTKQDFKFLSLTIFNQGIF